MGLAFESLIPIFFSFLAGINFHRLRAGISEKIIVFLMNISLYALLFFMGLSTGMVPDILSKIVTVGVNALILACSTSLFVIIAIYSFTKLYRQNCYHKKNKTIYQKKIFDIWGYIKDPLILILFVLIGFYVGHQKYLPEFKYENIATILLYIMIFLIGAKLAMTNLSFRKIFLKKSSMSLALFTILGTLIGAVVASLFLDLSLKNSLSLSAGFGWYTLSGVLFSKMGEPILASTAFLCDLFREIIALLLLPTLSRMGASLEAIGVSGAAAMDVTLPVIEKHCGEEYVPIAFISGTIVTIVVPILIPFFYYM